MTNEISLVLAFGAGLLSFLSPCVLPLIPSYLAFIGGASLSELRESEQIKGRLIAKTLAFILGFSVVFVLLGILFSGSVFAFGGASRWINIAAGGIVILLGFNIIFDFIKFLNYEKRFHVGKSPKGYLGAFFVGLAFGGGWSPCVGPILGGILFLAAGEGETLKAVLYLSAYSLGLGIPFLGTAVFFEAFLKRFASLKGRMKTVKIASGGLLILIGLLIITGRFQELNRLVPQFGGFLETWGRSGSAGSVLFPSALLLILGLFPLLVGAVRRKAGLSRGKLLFLFPFAAAAVLHGLGIVNFLLVLAGWFTYQGL